MACSVGWSPREYISAISFLNSASSSLHCWSPVASISWGWWALLIGVDEVEAAAAALLMQKHLHKPESIFPDLSICLETGLGHFHDNVEGNIAREDADKS